MRLEADRIDRKGAMDSAKALLAAIAFGRYEDGTTTLDHRLADLTWFSNEAMSTMAVESLVDGGLIAAVENERLRHYLVEWPRAGGEGGHLPDVDLEPKRIRTERPPRGAVLLLANGAACAVTRCRDGTFLSRDFVGF